MDNTRCTAGLVFRGTRQFDMPLLAGRLDKVLRLRGFAPGVPMMETPTHLRMPLGPFELHLNKMDSSRQTAQTQQMHDIDAAMGATQPSQQAVAIGVNDTSVTLTVTIVKCPTELPSLREAERSTVTAHSALALSTLELAQVLDPDFVQWLQPDMMLQTSSFLSVLEKVTPRRVTTATLAGRDETGRRKRPSLVLPLSQTATAPHQTAPHQSAHAQTSALQTQDNRVTRPFPDIETTVDRLESRTVIETAQTPDMGQGQALTLLLRHEAQTAATPQADVPAPQDSREPTIAARLATWAVSILVAMISLPVGLALMVYNLLRGEDLRLAIIALGLTGLVAGLVAAGVTAQALVIMGDLPVVGQMLTAFLV